MTSQREVHTYLPLKSKHYFPRFPDVLKVTPFFWFLCPWNLQKYCPFLRDFLEKHVYTLTWKWPSQGHKEEITFAESSKKIEEHFICVGPSAPPSPPPPKDHSGARGGHVPLLPYRPRRFWFYFLVSLLISTVPGNRQAGTK